MVKVTFEYDEDSRMWDAFVSGVENPVEAVQAFNAVMLTCQMYESGMHHKTEETESQGYKIIVGVP